MKKSELNKIKSKRPERWEYKNEPDYTDANRLYIDKLLRIISKKTL